MTWYQNPLSEEAPVVDNPIFEAFNFFNTETQPEEYRREQLNVLSNHYGKQINNVYQGDSTPAEIIISVLEQEVEFQDFFSEFFIKELNDKANKQADQKILKGKIKQKDIHKYLNSMKPTLSNLYSNMYSQGSVHNESSCFTLL